MAQPVFNSRRGHPIFLSANCIPEVLSIPADATLKTFTQRIDAREIEVDDSFILTDIDTPDDYDRAVAQFQAHRSEPCKQKV
jgi:molybdenum cofactor cytidylyltransferase